MLQGSPINYSKGGRGVGVGHKLDVVWWKINEFMLGERGYRLMLSGTNFAKKSGLRHLKASERENSRISMLFPQNMIVIFEKIPGFAGKYMGRG